MNLSSSSAASALISPVSVLMSPCLIQYSRTWCCSSTLSLTCSFLPAQFYSFSSSSLKRLKFGYNNQITKSSIRAYSLYAHYNNFNSCIYDTHHHCLPASLLSILVRHRRRRRLLFPPLSFLTIPLTAVKPTD